MENILEQAKQTAIEAVIKAGKIAKEHFDKEKDIVEKGSDGDLVTAIDHLAETEILKMITENFPDHQVRSEETGWLGVEGEWLWLVDPLDGTNNYAIGLPIYAVSITLLYKKEPIIGIIYDSHLEKLYVAEKGKGVLCNDKPIQVRKYNSYNKMTVGWIQGHQVQKNENAMKLKHYLDAQFKRVLRLWAPSLLWCMFARGDIDAIVLFNSEGDDLYAGILAAKEAGGLVMDFEGQIFQGMNPEPYIIACHPHFRKEFLMTVKNGLQNIDL